MSNRYYNEEREQWEVWESQPLTGPYLNQAQYDAKFPPPPTPPKTVEVAKEEAYTSLENYRREVEYGGTVVKGLEYDDIGISDEVWDTTEKDKNTLTSMLVKFSEPDAPQAIPDWKVRFGVYTTLTPEVAKIASDTIMLHYHTCFSIERMKQEEIAACTTVEEVENWLNTNLTVGWITAPPIPEEL